MISAVALFALVTLFGFISLYITSSGRGNNTGSEGQTERVKSGTSVSIPVGDPNTQYIQAAIDAAPEGTTFIIESGVHRLQTLYPDDGDVIQGEAGAILSGAKVLTGHRFDSGQGLYYYDGQTQDIGLHPDFENDEINSLICEPEAQLNVVCGLPEQLFIDSARLLQVETIAELDAADEWFFDYDADRIYLVQNPADKTVETTVTERAIERFGGADNVVVRNLTVEKYGARYQAHAVETNGGDGWLVEHNEIRYNSGGGIGVSDNVTIRNNYIHHNAQYGYGGNADVNITIRDNEISHNNNHRQYNIFWATGGGKLARSVNARLIGNYVHNNWGPGMWTDIDNLDTTYDGNVVVSNAKHGIQHEVSFSATISNNYVGFNGTVQLVDPLSTFNTQIFLQNSQDMEVYNNQIVIGDYGTGVIMYSSSRGYSLQYPTGVCDTNSDATRESTCTPWQLKNNYVYNNQIWSANPQVRMSGMYAPIDTPPWDYDTINSNNNRFDNNSYFNPYIFASGGDGYNFIWDDGYSNSNLDGYQALGQEINGNFSTDISEQPAVPAFTTTRGVRPGWGQCGDNNIDLPNFDGITEQCDDGNTTAGDGCSTTCQTEVSDPDPTPAPAPNPGSQPTESDTVNQNTTPVDRFWGAPSQSHFYTAGSTQYRRVKSNFSDDIWAYEGIVFTAWSTANDNREAVYRYWSPETGKHFYIISDEGRQRMARLFTPDQWTYEQVAYYAYETRVSGTTPLYRFWSPTLSSHFYTKSESQKNVVIATMGEVWRYEGIAFYVK